jgi:uncharacterized protein YndB with AHSA1/START domain
MTNQPIIIEQLYSASAEKIWKALTDKAAMKQWYFDLHEFRPEPGFEFRFWGGPTEDRRYLHICRITEVFPEKRLTYSWRYEGYEGTTLVSFELFEENSQTRLKLTHEGIETFPANEPDFARANFVEGWTWLICTSLKEFLNQK